MRIFVEDMLIVEDYLVEGNTERDAFDDASQDVETVRDNVRFNLEDDKFKDIEVLSIKFDQFDSANAYNAAAIFKVELSGSREDLIKVLMEDPYGGYENEADILEAEIEFLD